MVDFVPFPKIGRLSRSCVITEKIDGTNASIYIDLMTDPVTFLIGSRTRWITPETDNHGFARWATENKTELLKLGHGHHFGEWWGLGVQRGYGLKEKRFSLFNTGRWSDANVRPSCCHCVPVLDAGIFDTNTINGALNRLKEEGSMAAPGFMKPEGIVIWHAQARMLFKKTIDKDDAHKGE